MLVIKKVRGEYQYNLLPPAPFKILSYLKDDSSHAFFETCFKVLAALMPEERKYKNLTDFLK